MTIQFRILGPLDAGTPVPRGRTLSFLALLLVNRGAVVQLDRAVDELWDGAGPRHARNALHVVASRLRRAVGDDVVLSEGGGYVVRLAPGRLDADRFEDGFQRGSAELARGDPWEAAATLRHALALWRGPALADVADARFAQPEIARLEGLRIACLLARVDADLECGRHTEIVGELDALVRRHPLRERLRGQQMLALYRAGRQADALAAYRSGYRALVDGLGIEPSLELRALEAAILRQEVPAPATSAHPGQPAIRADDRRRVTCLFARSGRHGDLDPESLRAVLEDFHEIARAVCVRHGGFVAELQGNALLALFGTPVAHEDDALRALRASLELRARSFSLQAGVSTGEVVAAHRDAAAPVIGTAVGDAEQLARDAASGEIRIDSSTWRLVRHGAQAAAVPGGLILRSLEQDVPAIRRRHDRRLIGREEELGRLRATFDRVLSQRTPELLVIVGEPGIGKSHLAARFGAIAGVSATHLTGRCSAYGHGVTYGPLRDVVLQAFADRSADEQAAALGIAPTITHEVAAAVGLEDGDGGEDFGRAFLALIAALARRRPVVIVVDDAHLAEQAVLDALHDLVARLAREPVLVVWIARPELLESERVDAAGTLELGPLSAASSAALIEAIGGRRLDPAAKRRALEAAAGNPLFLEQLVGYLRERPSGGMLPPALHALLTARLDLLDAAERSVLALGAIPGETFATGPLHALAPEISHAELEHTCERLVERDLLIPEERSIYRFGHALIREAAYLSLEKSARARLHERYARWLADTAHDVPEADATIGFHLETACRFQREIDPGEGVELAARAGRRLASAAQAARGRGDLSGEIGFLDRALTLLGTDREEGAELLPALVSALYEAGSSDRAEAVAERAVSTSAALGLRGVGARAAIERERIRLTRHPDTFDVAASVEVTERAVDSLRGLKDELGLARGAYLMSDLTWLVGDVVASHGHAERMLAHARRAESEFDMATALTFMSWMLVEGPWPAPIAIARCEALAGDAAGLRPAELALLGCRAALVAMTGDLSEARADMASARAGLAELQLDEMAANLALVDALAEMLAGAPAAAERALLEAEALTAGSGDRWLASLVRVNLAHAILAQERHTEAAEALTRGEQPPARCDTDWVIKWHAARARLAARAGDYERGLEDARTAVAVADRTSLSLSRADAHRTLAELLWATGATEDAASAARSALALDEKKANVTGAATTRRRLAALLAPERPSPHERGFSETDRRQPCSDRRSRPP